MTSDHTQREDVGAEGIADEGDLGCASARYKGVNYGVKVAR